MNNALQQGFRHSDAAILAMVPHFWQECHFVPWEWQGLKGAWRRITLKKGSLLGEVAKYYVDDYIVWEYSGRTQEGAVEQLVNSWGPQTDVMSHRFLIIGSHTGSRPIRKHYWLGIRGWLEILPYCPGGAVDDKFKDLAYIADYGMNAALKEVEGEI